MLYSSVNTSLTIRLANIYALKYRKFAFYIKEFLYFYFTKL